MYSPFKKFYANEFGFAHFGVLVVGGIAVLLAGYFVSSSLETKLPERVQTSGEVAGIFDFLGKRSRVLESEYSTTLGISETTSIKPFAEAPSCESIGVSHDSRMWHGIWNSEKGCHWDHEHHANPHDMDSVFGSKAYAWFGSDIGKTAEISHPWATFSGAGANFEKYDSSKCKENDCKHAGYKWLYFKDRTGEDYIKGALLLGTHALTDARVQYHHVGGQADSLVRFHSLWVEAKGCYQGKVSSSTCGVYRGGGWIDMGRLNHPDRGDYAPLPGDPAAFKETNAELEPYRIHADGNNSLDSWQSRGNKYNFLSTDPTGKYRIRVGFGAHFIVGESPSETDPANFSNPGINQKFHCLDEATGTFTCDNNNSAAALFRTWVGIPNALDGSKYDEDKKANGYFTFHGYTNRYGDIVEGCTKVGLDCVPAEAENFPVGGCRSKDEICFAAYRGSVETDTYDGDIAPEGTHWIKYPN